MLGILIFDDVVVVGALLGGVGLVALGVWLYRKLSGPSTLTGTTSANWSVNPTAIYPSPGVGRFTFHVEFTPKGTTTTSPLPGREIKFTLEGISSGSGTITVISDQGGQRIIDSTTATGKTDSNGNITVEVQLEKRNAGATLNANDVSSGQSDPTAFTASL